MTLLTAVVGQRMTDHKKDKTENMETRHNFGNKNDDKTEKKSVSEDRVMMLHCQHKPKNRDAGT
jgi:hypothetical protein